MCCCGYCTCKALFPRDRADLFTNDAAPPLTTKKALIKGDVMKIDYYSICCKVTESIKHSEKYCYGKTNTNERKIRNV